MVAYQSPVMPSRSMGLLSVYLVRFAQMKSLESRNFTFAGGDKVVLLIFQCGREAQVRHRTRMTMTGQRNNFGDICCALANAHLMVLNHAIPAVMLAGRWILEMTLWW